MSSPSTTKELFMAVVIWETKECVPESKHDVNKSSHNRLTNNACVRFPFHQKKRAESATSVRRALSLFLVLLQQCWYLQLKLKLLWCWSGCDLVQIHLVSGLGVRRHQPPETFCLFSICSLEYQWCMNPFVHAYTGSAWCWHWVSPHHPPETWPC